MKKTLLLIFLGLASITMAKQEDAVAVGTEVSEELNINANVLAPLSITESQSMEFGDIIIGKAADSTTDGTMLIEGAPGNNVIVTVPNSTTIERVGVSGSTATVTLSSENNDVAQTLDNKGNLTQTIKGNIAEGQTTKTGEHTGTVTISVKYN
ncbi:DUF4402 domain-containing protein [Fusobacterium sp. MFO224]|uniref:DUF4402 domain-containing protein n=1 Tax=Fusobacterium sp. MFO224 TaxID=3378070 RepID=UPI0038548640